MALQLTDLRAFRAPRPGHAAPIRISARSVASRATAYDLVTTPHSGYHYDGSGRRFFEGWYFKVTLPGPGEAFSLIYSVEDPGQASANAGVGAQVMGPNDGYLCQFSGDTGAFWAEEGALELGACFRGAPSPLRGIVAQAAFDAAVQQGYQASQSWHQGSLVADETGAAGLLPSTVPSARWAFSVQPVVGWGPAGRKQRSTAGWLAALPVFEPHWQVLMALGRASGWLEWGGRRYAFRDAPAYAEKNWGGGFPKKWFWVQCDAFAGHAGEDVALTAIGAIRGLLGLPGVEETVGLVGLHWGGRFYEFGPATADLEWEVAPWGSWRVEGRSAAHRVCVEAACERPGTPLRAPTADHGLAPLCKDSFYGQVRVRLWERRETGGGGEALLLDARSEAAAVEVGGGPWWAAWHARSPQRGEPVRSLLAAPLDVEGLSARLPQPLRPRGL